ncbi:MAG: metal-dependent hydrolase [Thermodesulfobacteriota bacterium]
MATPYGHALVGLSLLHLWFPQTGPSPKKTYILYGLAVLGAWAPDLDFIPGLFLGNPGRFHHGPFHSLSLAIGSALFIGLLIRFFSKIQSSIKIGSLVFALVFSHLLLDFFTEDPMPPFGFPLFWPAAQTPFLSPLSIFPYVLRHPEHHEFWSHSFLSLAVESFILLPLLVLSWRKKELGRKS